MMVIQQLALLPAALFAGAALHITLVEQPARLALDTPAMLAQWKVSYARAAPIQATLAMLSGLAALYAWYHGAGTLWLAGAVLILANWPFTLLVVMPVNRRIMEVDAPDAQTARALVIRWGWLHGVRSLLGLAAATLFLFQIQ